MFDERVRHYPTTVRNNRQEIVIRPERHVAFQLGIAGAIDLTHTASTNGNGDLARRNNATRSIRDSSQQGGMAEAAS
jgi:hypothetical protein